MHHERNPLARQKADRVASRRAPARPQPPGCTATLALLLAIASFARVAEAQTPTAIATPTSAATPGETPQSSALHKMRFDEVVITGAPIPRTISELAQPVSVLEGEELLPLQAPQLGEVLGNQPGISQTYYGPGASRPVIRGLGGNNIRVLQNGLSLLDASALSPDHAVSLEPMLTKRIEIVRGPAALLYGPSAIGGVVNAITTRIPEERIDAPLRGQLGGRGNTANAEGAGIAVLEGGYEGFAYHLDGFGRKTDNLSIPGFARSAQLRAVKPLPPGKTEEQGELINTQISTQGGAGGASYIWDGGFAGVAPSVYNTTYGIPGAPSTYIDLSERRLDLQGAVNPPVPHVSTVKAKMGLVDYHHEELEQTTTGPVVGTSFKNRGYDLRLEGLHDQIGAFEGALGFESLYVDFSALGAEGFAPPTTTAVQSLFAFEEALLEPVRFQVGGRLDFSAVDAEMAEGFGPADSRDFVTGGLSLGAIYEANPASVALNVTYTQRPPNAEELYANGPHLATGQFEVGDRDLAVQESLGIEAVVRRAVGPVTGSMGAFYNRFNNFIDLSPTGEFFDLSELGHTHNADPFIPIFQFESVPATFVGMEGDATVTLVDHNPYTLDLDFKTDYVHTRNRDTGEPLPYVPTFRFGTGLSGSWDAFSGGISMLWARKQTDPAEFVLPTDGYVLLDIDFNYRFTTQMATVDLYLRGFNLADQTARVTTSTLKDIAPLPGAGALGGFHLQF